MVGSDLDLDYATSTFGPENLGSDREMSFIQREHDKLMVLCRETSQGETFNALYAAKQALAWALDPDTCASPSGQISRHYSLSIAGTKGTGIVFGNIEEPAVASASAA